MRAVSIGIVFSLAGCFGEGPVPSAPAQATVLMQLDPPSSDECGGRPYIGPIAIGVNYGYAGTLIYQPTEGCNNNGGNPNPPTTAVPIWKFTKDGNSPAMKIGAEAGSSDGTYSPRLFGLQGQDAVIWAATPGNMGGTNRIDVGGNGGTVATLMTSISSNMGFLTPIGIFKAPEGIYVGASNNGTTGRSEPNNPNYPCCGISNPGQSGGVALVDAATNTYSAVPVSAEFDCSHSNRCLVGNSDSLVWLSFSVTGGGWDIGRYLKAGTAPTELLVHQSNTTDTVPVGFHASDSWVVWAMSTSYDMGTSSSLHPDCEINSYDLVNHVDGPNLFTTDKFDCAGLSLDDESVYFAIVELNDHQHLHGLGIGRVHLDTRQFESIRVGVYGTTAGPRRVFFDPGDPESLIVADPFTIARIPKSALDGKHDFD